MYGNPPGKILISNDLNAINLLNPIEVGGMEEGLVRLRDAETGENIVWKAPMPDAGFAQPIVIGEKVITTADPNP